MVKYDKVRLLYILLFSINYLLYFILFSHSLFQFIYFSYSFSCLFNRTSLEQLRNRKRQKTQVEKHAYKSRQEQKLGCSPLDSSSLQQQLDAEPQSQHTAEAWLQPIGQQQPTAATRRRATQPAQRTQQHCGSFRGLCSNHRGCSDTPRVSVHHQQNMHARLPTFREKRRNIILLLRTSSHFVHCYTLPTGAT